ncbi:MAG: hypothetical protein LCH39_04600 [Proteobacteria bacterium]|nr:hypothetical protein [Pseudomonadota bacterium]
MRFKNVIPLLLALLGALLPPLARAQQPGVAALSLRATYGDRGGDIPGDLVWRIYGVQGSDISLVASSDQARPSFVLPFGRYVVHVSHGLAASMRELDVGGTGAVSTIPLNAGALTVTGHLGVTDRPIPPDRQKLQLFIATANNSEGRLVTDSLRPGSKLALPEGTYHLVSTYSGSNSVVRTDVKIETAKITEASVNHRAATMTLKLVRETGGVAIAGVQWTVETPGGDIVAEAVGAFPTVEIAEGSYPVTARLNDREFKGTMKVEGGQNRDFELVLE